MFWVLQIGGLEALDWLIVQQWLNMGVDSILSSSQLCSSLIEWVGGG